MYKSPNSNFIEERRKNNNTRFGGICVKNGIQQLCTGENQQATSSFSSKLLQITMKMLYRVSVSAAHSTNIEMVI